LNGGGTVEVARCACGRDAGYRSGAALLCRRHLITARRTVRRAAVTSLVVGSVLLAINQGDVIVTGSWSAALWWKVPLTYAVPYAVTTWGALSGARI
jgi:hypothetical protein